MKRTALNRYKGLDRTSAPLRRLTPLGRGNGAPRTDKASVRGTGGRRAISPASPAQRKKVKGQVCAVCARSQEWDRVLIDPAHVVDRSLLTDGQDDPRAVIPLCREHHDDYDFNRLDLLPYMEPRYRAELAFAVERFGLISTLRRVSNDREAGR